MTVVRTFPLTGCDSHSYKTGMEANVIKTKREALGLSQTKLGKAVGVTRFTILRWEQGAKPDESKLPKITEVLGIPAKEVRPDLVEKHEKIFGEDQPEAAQ